jgi:uncharacterized protein (UPF0335 family)
LIEINNQLFHSVKLTDTLEDEELIIKYNKLIAHAEEDDDFYPLEIFIAVLSNHIYKTNDEKIIFVETKNNILLVFANTIKQTIKINKDDNNEKELLDRNITRVVLGLDYSPYYISNSSDFTHNLLQKVDDKSISYTIKHLPKVRNKKSEDRSYTLFAIGIIMIFLFNSTFIKPRLNSHLELQTQEIDRLTQEQTKIDLQIKNTFKKISQKTPKNKTLTPPKHIKDYTKEYERFIKVHKKKPQSFTIKNGQITYHE